MIGNASGIGAIVDDRGNVNIMWNDQITTPVESFLSQELNAVTITNSLAILENTFTLSAGHNCVVGDYLEFFYYDDSDPDNIISRRFQSEISTIVTNTIRTGFPVSFAVDPLKIVANSSKRTNVNLGVVGAIDAKIKFTVSPHIGVIWDITGMTVDMLCGGQPDDGLFGDIAKLTWGVFFGLEKFGGAGALYGLNFKDNADFNNSGFNIVYNERSSPSGSWGVQGYKHFQGQENWGVVVRASQLTDDCLCAYTQDTLTGVDRIRMKVMGHEIN